MTMERSTLVAVALAAAILGGCSGASKPVATPVPQPQATGGAGGAGGAASRPDGAAQPAGEMKPTVQGQQQQQQQQQEQQPSTSTVPPTTSTSTVPPSTNTNTSTVPPSTNTNTLPPVSNPPAGSVNPSNPPASSNPPVSNNPPATVTPPPASSNDSADVVVTIPQSILDSATSQPTQPSQPAEPAQPTQPAATRKGSLLVPITPFSNMASGYQATNPGFRAILKDSSGKVIASGPLGIDSVIDGFTDDASQGSAYGRLVLNVSLAFVSGEVEAGAADGRHEGKLSLCMASDTGAAFDAGSCKSLGGNIHPERPFQWIDKQVSYEVKGDEIKITSYSGNTGEGGTRSQVALAVFHPAYGFAAPGKAFKDYQSPLVLDLGGNGELDLIDVWDERQPVRFDLVGDGAPTRTGWVAPADGLLALDVDGDGAITSGRELFGEFSAGRSPAAGTRRTFDDGFQALAMHDTNKDGRIDAKDAVFSRLLVWRDLNVDGRSEPRELKSLADLGIESISLAYVRTGSADKPLTVLDNEVRLQATYKMKDGRTRVIADVWFKQRRGVDVAAERK